MKKTKGWRKTADGYQIFAKVKGEFVSQHFPPETKEETLPAARELMVAKAKLGLHAAPLDGGATSLAADVKAYLKAKAGMPIIEDRTRQICWWRDTLGRQRSRDSVTSVEIRQHLEALRKKGRANGTLNTFRTALRDFYTVMNGEEGANPVRGVPKYDEEELPLDLPTIADALAAVNAAIHAKGPRKGGTKSQARLRVLLWTGWPSAILKRLRRVDIHWKTSTVTVHGRKKGGGTKPRTVPVLPQALEALKTFDALQAYGPFSGSALHSTFHRGCDRAGVRRCRVYDLRHRFGTSLVESSNDERGTAELMLHTSPRQTWRYTRAAASTRAVATIHAMQAALPILDSPKP